MTCRGRDRAIFDLADGRLEGEARRALEEHVAACPACRALHSAVVAGRAALAELGRQEPPPVDWRRIDGRIDAMLAGAAGQKRSVPTFALVGALAATAAVALVVTFGVTRPGPTRTGGVAVAEDPPPPVDPPAPAPLEAFVTFVSGEASLSRGEGEWRALGLGSSLAEGVRIRTEEGSAVGLQLGCSQGCRVESDSELTLATLLGDGVRVELDRGKVVCAAGSAGPPILLSVLELVASAGGPARYSVERSGQVVVVELAEGALRVRLGGDEQTVEGPARLTVPAEGESFPAFEPLAEEGAEELRDAALGLLPRRTLASLLVPATEGIERVSVDGASYGSLPLGLMRLPGRAEVLLHPTGGGEPIARTVDVSLGPTRLETEDLLGPSLRVVSGERRVAPRYGTLEKAQVDRLRTTVGGRVRGCYERMLKRDPSVWGRIQVAFTVSPIGEARSVRVTSLSGGHPDVNDCVESALAAERFPLPRGGAVPVEQTITLAPRF